MFAWSRGRAFRRHSPSFEQGTYVVEVTVVDKDTFVVRNRDDAAAAVDDLSSVVGYCLANSVWETTAGVASIRHRGSWQLMHLCHLGLYAP